MNIFLMVIACLQIGILGSDGRKSSIKKFNEQTEPDEKHQPSFEPSNSKEEEESIKHIKIPIIDVQEENIEKDRDNEPTYPKVYQDVNEPGPESEEYQAPSGEYDPPEYDPPKSGEVFDEDAYRQIVKDIKIPDIKFDDNEREPNTEIDPDLQKDENSESITPQLPPELVNIQIPTNIPKPSVKLKKKTKKQKKSRGKKRKPNKKERTRPKRPEPQPEPDQPEIPSKEYSQMVDNTNPKEDVIIIKPVRKNQKPKAKPDFFSDEEQPKWGFPRFKTTRNPIFFRNPQVRRKPKNINVVIQNKKKKPVLITHQNGDVIYWYPSKQLAPKRGNCKNTRFGSQCVRMYKSSSVPVSQIRAAPQMSYYKFPKHQNRPRSNNFGNTGNDNGFYVYKISKGPHSTRSFSGGPDGGIIKYSQVLLADDNQENGSFFKEIEDQGESGGIDEPEAENHEDERISDDEVESDKAAIDEEEENQGQEGEGEQEENEEGGDEEE